jgi:hypothetical protein
MRKQTMAAVMPAVKQAAHHYTPHGGKLLLDSLLASHLL